jgi:predicted 2-oxoglutarate/Fe(II)-dependent dioxygenase YbiX
MSALPIVPRPDDELDHRNPLVLTLANVLSPEACRHVIERIEAAGPTPAPITTESGFVMRPDLRNNTRVMFDDAALAAQLFERVAPHVPARLEECWYLCGANERLRCYRYAPGQFFAPHFDGAFTRNRDERSLLTLIVYLNACEAGGETRFLDLELAVRPSPGAALVFNHHLLHEGARVERGIKYALRTDLMYRRATGTVHSS